MVKASRPAATQLDAIPSVTTERPARNMPKPSASPGRTRPDGIGRLAVRAMTASMSASYHMLSAPDAPPPMRDAQHGDGRQNGCMAPGAATRPTSAVNTTSDITRGFSSAMKSRTVTLRRRRRRRCAISGVERGSSALRADPFGSGSGFVPLGGQRRSVRTPLGRKGRPGIIPAAGLDQWCPWIPRCGAGSRTDGTAAASSASIPA